MNLMVSGGALLLASLAFFGYELTTYRTNLIANRMTEAEIIGANSVSPLIFNDPKTVEGTLAALRVQYNDQQQQYQSQMQQNQVQQERYVDQTAQYENLRDHYANERSAYHREVWPGRYRDWVLARDERLIGNRVEITNGDHVGTVEAVARTNAGHVEALRVHLDSGKVVWIDETDIRFDRQDRVVMTDLDRGDLHQMADERL